MLELDLDLVRMGKGYQGKGREGSCELNTSSVCGMYVQLVLCNVVTCRRENEKEAG